MNKTSTKTSPYQSPHSATAIEGSYLTTAFWSSTTGDSGTPLDDEYSPDDLSLESKARLLSDLWDFIHANADLIERNKLNLTLVAHDFWLTRNHHGAGFWDGDYEEEIGSALTDSAYSYGGVDLYVGDDGLIYC